MAAVTAFVTVVVVILGVIARAAASVQLSIPRYPNESIY